MPYQPYPLHIARRRIGDAASAPCCAAANCGHMKANSGATSPTQKRPTFGLRYSRSSLESTALPSTAEDAEKQAETSSSKYDSVPGSRNANRGKNRGGKGDRGKRKPLHASSMRESPRVARDDPSNAAVNSPGSTADAGRTVSVGGVGGRKIPPPPPWPSKNPPPYSVPSSSNLSSGDRTSVLTGERPDTLVTINVSGERFQTYLGTLNRYPDSLLGSPFRRAEYWHHGLNEYFFDRNRRCFEAVLYIYQSRGRVSRPAKVPIELFVHELQFYDLGKEIMDAFWMSEGYEAPPRRVLPNNKTQRQIWELFEHADTSTAARVVACFSVVIIIMSITNFCLETIRELREPFEVKDNNTGLPTGTTETSLRNPFFAIEVFCMAWFSFEVTTRFTVCPDKRAFLTNTLNIIDIVSILPFYINLILKDHAGGGAEFAILRVLRLVRVFRIFKLSRHSVGLQILGKTFSASAQELMLLVFFMGIAIVLFASATYFVEQGVPGNDFTSIPAGFWYVIVTMTTVGYGDMVPKGLLGKVIGSVALLFGVLTIAMPVPIIVANFKNFYDQETRLAALRRALGRQRPGA